MKKTTTPPTKSDEPLAFWLIKELFGAESGGAEKSWPLSVKEVIAWMCLIALGFLLIRWLAGPLNV